MSNGNTIHLARAKKLSGSQFNLSHGSVNESTKKKQKPLSTLSRSCIYSPINENENTQFTDVLYTANYISLDAVVDTFPDIQRENRRKFS